MQDFLFCFAFKFFNDKKVLQNQHFKHKLYQFGQNGRTKPVAKRFYMFDGLA